jgi:mRNA interferase MazF
VVGASIERYGIYFAQLDPTRGSEMAKTRPAVVVSLDALNRRLETVVVCPLTTTIHVHWRPRLQVTCAGRQSEIAVDQIRVVSRSRLGKRIDRLNDADAGRLRALIREMYGE